MHLDSTCGPDLGDPLSWMLNQALAGPALLLGGGGSEGGVTSRVLKMPVGNMVVNLPVGGGGSGGGGSIPAGSRCEGFGGQDRWTWTV